MRHFIVTLLVVLPLLLSAGYSYSDADTDTDIGKGKLELENNRVKQAKEHFINALRRNPDSIEAKIELAKIYRQDSRYYEIGENLVQQVLEAEPDNIQALRFQAKIYYEDEKWLKASEVYKKLIAAYPDDYDAHISLSVILRQLGDLEGVRLLSEKMKEMHQPTSGK